MNFQIREEATEQGDSFELYEFRSEEFNYNLTSHNEDITYAGHVYTAIPIKRSSFTKNLTEGIIQCSVQAPVTTFFGEYILAFPVIPVTVEIRKFYFADTSQSALVFYGTVNGFSIQKEVAILECISSINELNYKVPRVFIQSLCNNVFTGPVCKYNAAWGNETVLAISEDGRILTLTGIDAAYGFYGGYKQGTVMYNHDQRFITEHVHDQIQIHFPLRDLHIGDIVQVKIGCNKQGITCKYKFGNLNNFVGMPYVPLGPNPVQWGVD